MADIRPFCAVRPADGYADRIASLPYDVYSRKEAKAAVQGHPDMFLNIDRAETQFEDSVDIYDDCVYKKANDLLRGMMADGRFIKDKSPYYYIYQLTMDNRSQTGLVACCQVDDYVNETIKRHENTRADKEKDRIRHVDTTNAQTGPIFLAYRKNQALSDLIGKHMQKSPLYDFVSEDGVGHKAWVIDDFDDIESIRQIFLGMDSLYIADGHHRCASAVSVSLNRRMAYPDDDEREAYNYFLSVLFPDSELKIMDYNRVLKEWNGYTGESLIEALREDFDITKAETSPYAPEQKGWFGMYMDHTWYTLKIKNSLKSDDTVDGLDVSILQTHVLKKRFAIDDPKTDDRIEFVGGIRGLKELEKRVDEGASCAFSMYPTSIEELFCVADEHRLMPPKSTWFEPKLRSGLFIHDITRGEKQYDE